MRTALIAVCTAALLAATAGTAQAAPSPSDPSSTTSICTPDRTLSMFSFNGFQGHIGNAAALFTPVVRERTSVGDSNVLLLSAGDNVGGSPFESATQEDLPALDILKVAGVDASAVGNHDLDRGFSDLRDRIVPHIDGDFPYLGANVRKTSTGTIASPLSASTIINRGGLKIGVVGAITKNLSSLVASAGISGLEISDPVAAVNAEAAMLKKNGADIVVAAYHEAAGGDTASPSPQSTDFSPIVEKTSRDVDVVFTGHTGRQYSWRTRTGAPLMQAESAGAGLAKVRIGYDSARRKVCSTSDSLVPAASRVQSSNPTISAIQRLADDAARQADALGQRRISTTSSPVTTAADSTDTSYGNEVRNRESTLSNMVAQMYKDTLGRNDPNFIGLQNPGGTRASLLNRQVTYKEAAQVLPFANTLATKKVTGDQFRRMLEQQWRTDSGGGTPSRAYLQLGMSSNVTYTYDESRTLGRRITSIWLNGRPVDPKGTYTIGSGTFLIDGGDDFTELAKGARPVDTGKVDLESWVSWIRTRGTLEPSFAKQAVPVTSSVAGDGRSATFTLGMPRTGGAAPDTVDLTSREAVRNRSVTAYLVQNGRKVKVASAPVTGGTSTVTFAVPAEHGLTSGDAVVRFEFPGSGTVVRSQIRITVPTDPVPAAPVPPSTTPSPAPTGTQTSPAPTSTQTSPAPPDAATDPVPANATTSPAPTSAATDPASPDESGDVTSPEPKPGEPTGPVPVAGVPQDSGTPATAA
ncbi:bifunctional metallophosphatase/5'-nucleotidase [Acidipropionibacterium virtanenii]|uniref:bifunctional metallophosphatase/5'-nucleotidase n=1 Tax=Acidipropionibacterium virtanenii TaxID=2057246 RepID=UPI000DECAE19|nr:bifunctional UDP-sugar hydrolase/5'-nucleotidase [Acidipropionibacterium virtanenii]